MSQTFFASLHIWQRLDCKTNKLYRNTSSSQSLLTKNVNLCKPALIYILQLRAVSAPHYSCRTSECKWHISRASRQIPSRPLYAKLLPFFIKSANILVWNRGKKLVADGTRTLGLDGVDLDWGDSSGSESEIDFRAIAYPSNDLEAVFSAGTVCFYNFPNSYWKCSDPLFCPIIQRFLSKILRVKYFKWKTFFKFILFLTSVDNGYYFL